MQYRLAVFVDSGEDDIHRERMSKGGAPRIMSETTSPKVGPCRDCYQVSQTTDIFVRWPRPPSVSVPVPPARSAWTLST